MNFLKLAVLTLTAFSLSVFAQDNDQLKSCHHNGPVSPLPDGVKLNKYKLLLTVGADEDLILNPITVGPEGFSTIFNLNSTQVETVRQAAIDWLLERFGIDFTGGFYDPVTGITSTADAVLVPISFEGTYRVLSSNNKKIPVFGPHHPSLVRIAEYTVVFLTTPTYTGTYASAGPVVGNVTDTLTYGIYKIFTDKKQHHGYSFFMRSYFPTVHEPIASAPIPRFPELFQLNSSKWGPGFGVLNVGVATAPVDGKYPTFTRASWSFPGSYVLPDYNTFTVPPLVLP